MPKKSGFTLIELLVVIAIIAILSLIGITMYTSTLKSARDAKRKEDVEAISKAFELYYSGGSYTHPENGWFGSGGIPKDPEGTDYYWNGVQAVPSVTFFPTNQVAPTYTICAQLKISSGNSDDQNFTTYKPNNDGPYFCRKNIQ